MQPLKRVRSIEATSSAHYIAHANVQKARLRVNVSGANVTSSCMFEIDVNCLFSRYDPDAVNVHKYTYNSQVFVSAFYTFEEFRAGFFEHLGSS